MTPSKPQDRAFDWRLWAVLTGLASLGAAIVTPLMLQATPYRPPPPAPLALLMALAVGQSALLMGLAAAVGLRLSASVGRYPAMLAALVRGRTAELDRSALLTSAVIGLATGAGVVCVDALLFEPEPPLPAPAAVRLAGGMLYGGLGEEILCRLLLMSLIVWIAAKLSPGAQKRWGTWAAAMLIAAGLFAIGHLPAASVLSDGDPAVGRILVLNGGAGVVFGWLYWRRGFETAVVAHAGAHLPLQLLVV